jgi:hypothetical protein
LLGQCNAADEFEGELFAAVHHDALDDFVKQPVVKLDGRLVFIEDLTSLESHHSRDLREAPSLAATAHGTLFVPLQRSACDWTQVSLMLLPVMAFGADAPHRPTHRSCGLSVSPTAEGR